MQCRESTEEQGLDFSSKSVNRLEHFAYIYIGDLVHKYFISPQNKGRYLQTVMNK